MGKRHPVLVVALLAGVAGPADAQSVAAVSIPRPQGPVLQRPARLVIDRVPLITALERLSETSGVQLVFSPTLLSGYNRTVQCECHAVPLGTALNRLLAGTVLRYTVLDGYVVIVPEVPGDAPKPRVEAASLVLGSLDYEPAVRATIMADPQDRPITGVVVDERGRSVVGASVVVVSSGARAATDGTGRFRVDGPPGPEASLRVTAIGYRPLTQTVRVDDAAIRLVLTEAVVKLDEVVVTGTVGEAQMRSIGNAVARIEATDVVRTGPVSEVGQLLKGRAAGVLVRSGLGSLGTAPKINIRGSSSLNLTDQPLVYVDGVRVDNSYGNVSNWGGGGRLNDVNAEDIESVEIIKGPAAATLYGTEASSGVIQIITKRGTGTAPEVNVQVSQGAMWMRNPEGRYYRTYYRDPAGAIQSVSPVDATKAEGYNPYRTGWNQGYNLSVAGGNDRTRYYLSGEFQDNKGVEEKNAETRYGARASVSSNINDKLQVDGNLGYVRVETDIPTEGAFGGTMFALTTFRPSTLNTPVRGWLFGSPRDWTNFEFFQNADHITGSFRVNHRPTSWFSHRATLGVDRVLEETIQFRGRMSPQLALVFGQNLAAGAKSQASRLATNWTFDYGASVNWSLSRSVGMVTSAGAQYYRVEQDQVTATGNQFPAPGLSTISSLATTTAGETYTENATAGVYVQQQISLNNRVFLTGALRADDNSAFGENFDLVAYPKLSATWVLSEEPFWKTNLISTLKLRAAYGRAGKQPIAFAATQTFTPVTGAGAQPALSPASIGNPNLKPEVADEIELGFDAALFDNRVGFEVTYYNQRTKDLLAQRVLPPSSPFPGFQFINLGEVKNSGFEVLINPQLINTRNVSLDVSFNLGTNSNEVVRLGPPAVNGSLSLPLGTGGGTGLRHAEGFPLASWFDRLIVSADLDAAGNAINVMCDGGAGKNGLEPGGGPVPCATAPFVYLGRSQPSVWGAVSPTLRLWQRLNVSAQVDFQAGYESFDAYHSFRCGAARACEELFFPERFDGPPVAAYVATPGMTAFAIHDASFAKLRELSASYAFSPRLARSLGAKSLSLTVAAREIGLWTGFPGLDPESRQQRGTIRFDANNYNASPSYTRFITKVNVTF